MKTTKTKIRPTPKTVAATPKIKFTLQVQLLIGLGLLFLAIFVTSLLSQPQNQITVPDQNVAIATALAVTGVKTGPTAVPGSEFGVSFGIYGIKDYTPLIPGEKISFYINNTRQKSLFISNCDGVVLQRFLGTDIKDKAQTDDLNKWANIAPGGIQFCGPVSGRQARQIPPQLSADATFDFSKTQPFKGQDWNIPGIYRLFVIYYLLCPSGSDKIAECEDLHYYSSDAFRIVAPDIIKP